MSQNRFFSAAIHFLFFYLLAVPVIAGDRPLSALQPGSRAEANSIPTEQGEYFKDHESIRKGWYWYRDEKPVEEVKKPDTKNIQPAPADLWNMPVEELSKYLENAKKTAIGNPTVGNVARFIEVQDVVRRKSLAFANVYTLVMQTHPEFTVDSASPFTAAGIAAERMIKEQEIKRKISESREDFALLYFYRPECQYCQAQSEILKNFAADYGWNIKPIDINKDVQAALRFNIEIVPYIMLVYRVDGSYKPVAVGVVSSQTLDENVYRTIRLMKGEVSPESFSTPAHLGGTSLDPTAAPLSAPRGNGGGLENISDKYFK